MAPSVSVGEITNRYSMPSTIDVDCLLPNGFLISLNCSRETTLNELKQMVWKEFKKSFCSIDNQFDLKTSENYIFTSVTQEAKTIEYFDLMKRLCDLRLFCPFFQLIEIQGNLEEKALNSDLSKAIGLYISEIEQFKDSELVEFRLELFKFLSSLKQNEKQKTQSDKLNEYLQFSYSANLDLDNIMLDVDVSKTISSLCSFKIGNTSSQLNKIDVNVHVSETNQPQITYQLDVSLSNTPNEVIGEVIKAKLSGMHQSHKQINQVVEKYKDKYLLNVCGCDEVLYGNEHKIGSYKVSD
jgi:phosphatidylinositol-4,5-bisphosphate 3-kinase